MDVTWKTYKGEENWYDIIWFLSKKVGVSMVGLLPSSEGDE